MREKILKHYAIEKLYKDSDGWWADLKEGYNWFGVTAIHENTLTGIYNALRYIEKNN